MLVVLHRVGIFASVSSPSSTPAVLNAKQWIDFCLQEVGGGGKGGGKADLANASIPVVPGGAQGGAEEVVRKVVEAAKRYAAASASASAV